MDPTPSRIKSQTPIKQLEKMHKCNSSSAQLQKPPVYMDDIIVNINAYTIEILKSKHIFIYAKKKTSNRRAKFESVYANTEPEPNLLKVEKTQLWT